VGGEPVSPARAKSTSDSVRAAENRMVRHEGGRREMCWDGERRVHLGELVVLVKGDVGDGVDGWVHPKMRRRG
jgi:hypothetical protein